MNSIGGLCNRETFKKSNLLVYVFARTPGSIYRYFTHDNVSFRFRLAQVLSATISDVLSYYVAEGKNYFTASKIPLSYSFC